jgi:hypothetical protein
MWWLFQSLIIFAVLVANSVYEGTPNPIVIGSVAGLAALAATVAVNQLLLFLRSVLRSVRNQRRA